jgi:hypothetical protein
MFVLALGMGTMANFGHTQTQETQTKPTTEVQKTKEKPKKAPRPAKSPKNVDPKTTPYEAAATAAAYQKGIQQPAPK